MVCIPSVGCRYVLPCAISHGRTTINPQRRPASSHWAKNRAWPPPRSVREGDGKLVLPWGKLANDFLPSRQLAPLPAPRSCAVVPFIRA